MYMEWDLETPHINHLNQNHRIKNVNVIAVGLVISTSSLAQGNAAVQMTYNLAIACCSY